MRNYEKLLILLLLPLLFYSCNNTETPSGQEIVYDSQKSSEKLEIIARGIANNLDKIEYYKELSKSIDVSLAHDYDEVASVENILEEQSTLKNLESSGLKNALLKSLRSGNKLKSQLSTYDADLVDYSVDNNVILYWPYKENWDGVTTPYITFDPENGQTENLAYRQEVINGEIILDEVMVNEEFAKVNPVIVVNTSPNSIDLNNIDIGGVVRKTPTIYGLSASQQTTTVNVWYLETVMVSTQHDDWFNGGSEFDFTVALPELPGYVKGAVNRIRQTFTRSEISNKRWRTVHLPLNSDWTPEQVSNYLVIKETDSGGSNNSFDASVGVNIAGKLYGISIKIPFGSNDDDIFAHSYARTYILSPANQGVTHESRGVHWTMPIKTIVY